MDRIHHGDTEYQTTSYRLSVAPTLPSVPPTTSGGAVPGGDRGAAALSPSPFPVETAPPPSPTLLTAEAAAIELGTLWIGWLHDAVSLPLSGRGVAVEHDGGESWRSCSSANVIASNVAQA